MKCIPLHANASQVTHLQECFVSTALSEFCCYSAFANSCSLQTDTFFFNSFIDTMSYSLQTRFCSVIKDWADKYGVPPRGHLQGQTRDS